MESHLLVTVSNDPMLYAVRFVCSFFYNLSWTKVTLFCVATRSMTDTEIIIGEDWFSPDEIQKAKLGVQQEQILASCSKMLTQHDLLEKNIEIKIISKKHSIVKDIVREGHTGKYDAVVLGRIGASAFERLLTESVTDSILAEIVDFPIWICKNPEEGRKNVLLCVDDSDASLRIADHVGFILAKEKEHTVTIFHVNRGQGIDHDKMFDSAQDILERNGVEKDRINRKTVTSLRIVSSIENEAHKFGYAVVATGLIGRHRGKVQQWFAGKTAIDLVNRLEKVVLWTCR